jgi:hypothetical protein
LLTVPTTGSRPFVQGALFATSPYKARRHSAAFRASGI